MVMASLANLSKYLGVYSQWKQTVRDHGLKWERGTALDTFINILNSNLENVKAWLKDLLSKLPKTYASVLVFTSLTGLRPTESCNSCSLITKLHKTNKLEKYFDEDLSMLQHFRYPELFIRKCKNAYISFISENLLSLVIKTKPEIHYSALDTKINRLGFNNKTKQLRKLFATTLRSHLPQELIDLLQGRISQTVFMKFYYRPLLKGIINKTLEAIKPLEKLIKLMQQK